jgi:hypothetical protein
LLRILAAPGEASTPTVTTASKNTIGARIRQLSLEPRVPGIELRIDKQGLN